MHLEDCLGVSGSCACSHVQEIQDRIWILCGMSCSGVLGKGSILGVFCMQDDSFFRVHKSPSECTLFRISKHQAAALELLPAYAAVLPSIWKFQTNRRTCLFFPFLCLLFSCQDAISVCGEKKGCMWRNLDICQISLRLLSFSGMKCKIECKY